MNSLVAQQAQPSYKQYLVVAADGTGDYKKIQDAIDAVRAYSPEHIRIFIKNGVYHEKVNLPAWVTNISIIGESKENTIIVYEDYSGKFISADTVNNKKKFTTFTTYTFYVQGNDVTLENLTIKNVAGRVGQAVALHVDGTRVVIKNCNLLGNQDTLLAGNDNCMQFYLDCYIEGTTDFIFGAATAIFQNCTIKSLTDSYITAASTSKNEKYGYVFFNCKLIAGEGCTKEFLGRPWRAYAKVVFIKCELGNHILPEGWDNWKNTENEKTAYYAEYNNSGAGSVTDKRVKWSHFLADEKEYTIEKIFNGWIPLK